MKKTLLAVMAIVSLCSYAQQPIEGFEESWNTQWATLPGWYKFGNGVDWVQSELNNPLQPPYSGNYAAYLAPENAPLGTTSDWLATPELVVGTNMSLRFYSRLLQDGDQGSIYKIMYSPASTDPTIAESYTELQSWTELELNPNQLEYTEKIVNLPATLTGTSVRFAFVMIGGSADGWLVDDVKILSECFVPTNLSVTNITSTSAQLNWSQTGGATSWEIEVVPVSAAPTGTGILYSGSLPYTVTDLQPDIEYRFYVRALCQDGGLSSWVGPYYFSDNGCMAPTNVQLSESGLNTQTYSWTDTGAGTYDYWYTETNAVPNASTIPSGIISTPTVVLAGLVPGEEYKFYVRSNCGPNNVSPWVGISDEPVSGSTIIHGIVQYDSNNNGICDEDDNPVPSAEVQVSVNGLTFSVYTNSNGEYSIYDAFLSGTHTFSFQVVSSVFTPIAPVVQQVNFDEENTVQISHCLGSPLAVNDLRVTFVSLEATRPGFDTSYKVFIQNSGSTLIEDALVNLSFDNNRTNYVSSGFTGVSASAGSLSIPVGDLQAFSSVNGIIVFHTIAPPTNVGGETLHFEAALSEVPNDATPNNNQSVLNQVIVNSFDPNDITVHEGDKIYEEQAEDYLTYTIRFQNTGNGEAINIRLENILDDLLDWETFEPIASSHNYNVKRSGNQLEFFYPHINLPYESADEPGSHGFVTYKVKPKAEFGLGDIVSNTAEIYFDFNEAIVTNTATTEVVEILGLNDNTLRIARLYPNPVKDQLNVEVTQGELQSVAVYDINGRLCLSANAGIIDTNSLNSGIYFVKVTTDAGSANYKVVKH